jgi:tRNA(Arg) A34 adenosine deaminase TadA
MGLALVEARAALATGDVPVGAVLVDADGAVLGAGRNAREATGDPTAHAEVLALREACRAAGSERLPGHSLWVTLEPCPMCAAAIGFARVGRLYFGAADPKSGGVLHGPRIFSHPQAHHAPEVYDGIGAEEAGALLRGFFASLRES